MFLVDRLKEGQEQQAKKVTILTFTLCKFSILVFAKKYAKFFPEYVIVFDAIVMKLLSYFPFQIVHY